MRNILEKVRRCDRDEVKAEARAIYRAASRKAAQAASDLSVALEKYLSGHGEEVGARLAELLSFFPFPRHL